MALRQMLRCNPDFFQLGAGGPRVDAHLSSRGSIYGQGCRTSNHLLRVYPNLFEHSATPGSHMDSVVVLLQRVVGMEASAVHGFYRNRMMHNSRQEIAALALRICEFQAAPNSTLIANSENKESGNLKNVPPAARALLFACAGALFRSKIFDCTSNTK